MLDPVRDVSLRFLDQAGDWQPSWPPADQEVPGLPRAVEFTLDLEDYGLVTRIFALPG